MTESGWGPSWSPPRRLAWAGGLAAGLTGAVVVALLAGGPHRPADRDPAGPAASTDVPVPCVRLSAPGSSAPLKATTISTVEQAYSCILAHYYGGPTLDTRALLVPAFAAFTQELQRRGVDQPDATLPELTGDRRRDWAAFSVVYRQVTDRLPPDADLRQALAAVVVNAMVASLNDDHASWVRAVPSPGAGPDDVYGLGMQGLSAMQGLRADPTAVPPLFVTSVLAGSPAARQDVRPGDVITAVNDVPPFIDGVFSAAVLRWLNQRYPRGDAVRLAMHRPSTGAAFTVTLTPAVFRSPQPDVSARPLRGDVGYVKLPGFVPGSADRVLRAIDALRAARALRGVILDLRGNNGGPPPEAARLLGAFAHGRITGYDCDIRGACTANRTDDSVALLNLPLTVLVDRSCASACEDFSGAVRGLGLGQLVGSRTAGVVAGPAGRYLLTDNSVLNLPSTHHLGPNKEHVDTIGVAPDNLAPQTADDLSAGRDPGVDKALSLLS